MNLIKQFKKIGLVLNILKNPMGGRRVNRDIFQMDIKRKIIGTRRFEWFEIYPGHKSNIVHVLDVDTKLNQLLLLVKEAPREFEVNEVKSFNKDRINSRRKQLQENRTAFTETQNFFIIKNKTFGGNRHFLMGVDERQLFVAQLKNGVTNITEAKRQLGSTVLFHESTRKMTPSRQGEWFFVSATKKQEEILDLLLKKQRIFILKAESIGKHARKPGGNPHIADELVVIPAKESIIIEAQSSKWAKKNKDLTKVASIYPIRQKEVFVRGCVRHKDHKTIKYSRWHQVILNNEGATASATQSWID
jgi:hypothetical protein